MNRPLATDDRAVSITVTHVLTLGITSILISGLLLGAGTMLDTQRDDNTRQSLETIGERLAGEISHADQLSSGEDDTANVTTTHPRSVTQSQYTVELIEDCREEAPLIDYGNCLRLSVSEGNIDVYVPVSAEVDDGATVRGGTIEVVADSDGVTIENP